MFTTIDDVVEVLTISLSTAASLLSEEGLEAAVNDALTELGWSLPITEPKQIMWVSRRALRHACYILWVASAQKFKYKQVNLQQRFEHYEKLIKHMDAEFAAALSDDMSTFITVDVYRLFGTAVGPGFVYDTIGRDLTYSQLVNYINTEE